MSIHQLQSRKVHCLFALVPLLATASCGGSSGGSSAPPQVQTPTALQRVSGDPQSGSAGQVLSSSIVVKVVDDAEAGVPGVRVNWTVTGGGSLSSSSSLSDNAGLASVAWTLGAVTGINTLRAQVAAQSAIAPVTFTATGVAGTAVGLAFLAQPTNAVAGAAGSSAIRVAIVDATGNTVSSATSAITLALGANPGGGALAGVTTADPTNGVASFSGLSINKAGAGYTLVASSAPLPVVTSTAFSISPAAAAKLAFTTQPGSTTAGLPISPAVTVSVQDAFGNAVPTASDPITISFGVNPASGTLTGTATLAPSGGAASFAGLAIDKAASGYTILATAGSLTSASSTAFTVLPGPVAAVWMNPGAAAVNWTTGPYTVQLYANPVDEFGNPVTSAVVWSTSDPNIAGVSASGLVTNGGGTVTISASAGGQVGTALVVSQCGPPRCGAVSASFSALTASVRAGDAFSADVTISRQSCGSWTGVMSLAIGANPTGATLTGTQDIAVSCTSMGATWPSLRIDKPGTYTLVAVVKSTSGTDFGGESTTITVMP